jgi:hypothetical protein
MATVTQGAEWKLEHIGDENVVIDSDMGNICDDDASVSEKQRREGRWKGEWMLWGSEITDEGWRWDRQGI